MMRRPVVPVALGLAGLIPFVGAAAGTVWLPDFLQPVAHFAALVYGLAIVAFLGGIHWGIALEAGGAGRYVWSVVPPLVGFFAVFAPRPLALWALCAAILITGIVDVAMVSRTGPGWFARLRIVLTVLAAASLAFAALNAGDLRVDPFGTIVRPG